MNKNLVFFSGRANNELGQRIIKACGYDISSIQYTKFADGEYKPALIHNVRSKTVFIIQSTNATLTAAADNLYELLMLVDAAKRASAERIIAVIPYYGYARQERKDEPRTPITAKLNAILLEKAGVDRIITMDLHADAIQGFFEIPVDNLYASYLFVPLIKELQSPSTMFASADAGGVKRANAYAKFFNADAVVCLKSRDKPNEVDDVMVIGNPAGKDIFIIEDIIDTAGTIVKVSEELHKKGAKSIRIFATHGIFSRDAYYKILGSPIDKCYVTDSLPYMQEWLLKAGPEKRFEIVPSEELFAKAIRRNIEGNSIKELFLF